MVFNIFTDNQEKMPDEATILANSDPQEGLHAAMAGARSSCAGLLRRVLALCAGRRAITPAGGRASGKPGASGTS
jgi:hypothetical protein